MPTDINPEIMAWEKKKMILESDTCTVSLLFISCVPLDKLLDLSERQRLHPQNQYGCILGVLDSYKISYMCSLSLMENTVK